MTHTPLAHDPTELRHALIWNAEHEDEYPPEYASHVALGAMSALLYSLLHEGSQEAAYARGRLDELVKRYREREK